MYRIFRAEVISLRPSLRSVSCVKREFREVKESRRGSEANQQDADLFPPH